MLDNFYSELKKAIDFLRKNLNSHTERLRVLQNTAARYGYSTAPETVNEIESIKFEMSEEEKRLKELEDIRDQIQGILDRIKAVFSTIEEIERQLDSLPLQRTPHRRRSNRFSILILLFAISVFFVVLYTKVINPMWLPPQPTSYPTPITGVGVSEIKTSTPSPVASMTVTIESSQIPKPTMLQSPTPQNTNEASPPTTLVQPTTEPQPSDIPTVIPSLTSTLQPPTDIPRTSTATPTLSPAPTFIQTFTPSPLPSLLPTEVSNTPSAVQPNVQNGDFEDESNDPPTKQWIIINSNGTKVANQGHDSNRSLRFESQEPDGDGLQNAIAQNIKGLPPNKAVRLSAWVQVESSDVQVRLFASDDDNLATDPDTCTERVTFPVGGWHKIELNYVTTNSGIMRIAVYIYGKGIVYIDDIFLEPSSDTTKTPCSQRSN